VSNFKHKYKYIFKNVLFALLESLNIKEKELVYDTIASLLEFSRHNPDINDQKLINTTIHEIHKSFQVFHKYRDVRKVCIFGSARTKPEQENYKLAQQLAERLCENGLLVVTGAGPGIMEAGNKGAGEDQSFGLNILLPFEQEPNPYIANSKKLISYKYFYVRKLAFVKETDASIIFPGGFGTHDEGFELLTLIQTGRASPRPVILMAQPQSNYWEHWQDYVKTQLLDRKYISEEDLDIYELCDNVDDAIESVNRFYSVYHSVRYIGKQTVFRLNKPLSSKTLKTINKEFKHLLVSGKFELKHAIAIPEESDSYPEKIRLVFNFNKANYGGLCRLIHYFTKLEGT